MEIATVMTTTFLLIRHAAHGHVGQILTGRMEGVGLSIRGQQEASQLGETLRNETLGAVYSSPSLRARQTAEAVASPHALAVERADAMAEVEFGAWTGRSFDDLAADPDWQAWNTRRGTARVPGGESMAEVQDRAWHWLENATRRFDEAVIAVVSHCDVIRAVVARVLGLPLDNLLRFDVDTASISRVVAGDWGASVVRLNERAA